MLAVFGSRRVYLFNEKQKLDMPPGKSAVSALAHPCIPRQECFSVSARRAGGVYVKHAEGGEVLATIIGGSTVILQDASGNRPNDIGFDSTTLFIPEHVFQVRFASQIRCCGDCASVPTTCVRMYTELVSNDAAILEDQSEGDGSDYLDGSWHFL